MVKTIKALFFLLLLQLSITCATVTTTYTGAAAKAEPMNLVVENTTPYEISHIYAAALNQEDWGDDLLEYEPLDADTFAELNLPQGVYKLKAEILVDNELHIIEEMINFFPGKKYLWKINSAVWIGHNGSYEYLQGNYSYLAPYAYLDQ